MGQSERNYIVNGIMRLTGIQEKRGLDKILERGLPTFAKSAKMGQVSDSGPAAKTTLVAVRPAESSPKYLKCARIRLPYEITMKLILA